MNKHKKLHSILNAVIPLIVGAMIYYFLSPDVKFVKFIDEIIGKGVHFPSLLEDYFVVKFIRFYLLDMLWGYALVFSLSLILGNNAAKRKMILLIAVAFSTVMELLQLTPLVGGTFDLADLLVEGLSEVLAVFIIKITHEEALK